MSNSKDKRTKGQILRLLDNALTHEELLAEKIKVLESELSDCRKKAEDPRHELTEEAMSASKVSFRIDYYRTSEEGPLKGIIEHLPSRQNKAFEGEGQLTINNFMSRFLTEETGNNKKKSTTIAEENKPQPTPVESNKEEKTREKIVLAEESSANSGSRIAQRLRAEFALQMEAAQRAAMTAPPQGSKPVQRIMPRNAAPPPSAIQQTAQPGYLRDNKITAQMQERRLQLPLRNKKH